MGSVIATWKGSCVDESIRRELFSYLYEFAILSEKRRTGDSVPRPAFLEALATSRALPESLRTQDITVFDQLVTGNIGIERGILAFEDLDESIRDDPKRVSGAYDWPLADGACGYGFYSTKHAKYVAVEGPSVRLKGLAFRLYDPRGLYPGEDVMSFVFVDAPGFPQLHGKMVHPLNREEVVAFIDRDVAHHCDWFLCTPSIHLRYLLENWLDGLMAWIKVFFLPDLAYWRYEEASGLAQWKESFDRLIESYGREFTQATIFEYLVDAFEREACDWDARVSEMAAECESRIDSLAARIWQGKEPLAKTVLHCLTDDGSTTAMRNLSADVLARMSESIDAHIFQVMRSTFPDHWEHVRDRLLPLFSGDRIQKLLQSALSHDAGEVRLRACEYLAQRLHPEHEPQNSLDSQAFFESLLLQIPTAPEDLRHAIIQAIVNMNDDAMTNLQAMMSAPNESIQLAGIDGWSSFLADTPRCNRVETDALKAMLAEMTARLDHVSPSIRIAAAIALQRTATVMACRQLCMELQSDSSDIVLKAAQGYQSMADKPMLNEVGEQLRTILRDGKTETIAARRVAAAQLSGSQSLSPTSLILLRKGIQDNEDPWRHEYFAALRPFGSSAVVRRFADLISEAMRSDSRLEKSGLELLIEWQPDLHEVSDAVFGCLNSPSATVRTLAVTALGKLKPPHADSPYRLSRMLLDSAGDVVEQACIALGKHGQAAEVFVPNILELDERFPMAVLKALEGIATMQAKVAVAGIYGKSQDGDVLRYAYRMLNAWGMTPDVPPPADEAAEELLRYLFETTDSETTQEADHANGDARNTDE